MTSGLRQAIFFVLLIGVAALGYQGMIKPANRKLTETKQKLDGKRAKLAEFEQATAKTDDLNKQLEQLQEPCGSSRASCPRPARCIRSWNK